MQLLCRLCICTALFVESAPHLHGQTVAAAADRVLETEVGDATYYASRFQGRTTASGRKFDGNKAVAAHRTYPFGTVVRVTNLRNGRSVNVVIIDRGPYGKNQREGAVIDLSPSAAKKLGILKTGQERVKVEVLAWGDDQYVNDADGIAE